MLPYVYVSVHADVRIHERVHGKHVYCILR